MFFLRRFCPVSLKFCFKRNMGQRFVKAKPPCKFSSAEAAKTFRNLSKSAPKNLQSKAHRKEGAV